MTLYLDDSGDFTQGETGDVIGVYQRCDDRDVLLHSGICLGSDFVFHQRGNAGLFDVVPVDEFRTVAQNAEVSLKFHAFRPI